MRPSQTKLTSLDYLQEALIHLNKPLVFTNGCFDILHRGHVSYLETARQLGGSLMVALNSDESTKRLNKGHNRPINPLADRMAIIASLECVDAVISFDQDTPLKLIKLVKPDYLVKGGDWPAESIVGNSEVTAYGGQVLSIAFDYERSTSALIDKIRASKNT